MKFNRTDLITRVEAAITAQQKHAEERTAKALQQHLDRRAEYLNHTRDAWKQFADTIRARLRADKPITRADIPRDLADGRYAGGYVATWDDKPPTTYTADTTALEQLLVLLHAATDDEISTSALERMGFRTAQLFTH